MAYLMDGVGSKTSYRYFGREDEEDGRLEWQTHRAVQDQAFCIICCSLGML